MSNRIIEADIEAEIRSIWNETGKKDFHPVNRHLAYCALFEKLQRELKRCYKEIDKLRKQPVSITCEHCSHVYEEEFLHELLEMGPSGECAMCLEEASLRHYEE